MKLQNRTDVTRLYNDRVSLLPLNPLQQRVRSEFLSRLDSGDYRIQEHQVCPVCACSEGILVAEKDRYGIPHKTVICCNCGLVFNLDPLDAASLAHFYQHQYRKLYEGEEQDSKSKRDYHQNRFKDREQVASDILYMVEKYAQAKEPGVVLEIGTGGGWNLIGFPAKRWTAIGYDYDVEEMRHGQERGLDLRYGNIDQAVADNVKADLILMIQFLEHASDPVHTLKQVGKLLKHGGIFFVGVPGLKSLVWGGWGDRLAGTLQNAHLFLFELETLDRAAAQAGLSRVWGMEGLTAIYTKTTATEQVPSICKMRGRSVLNYIRLTEMTALIWKLIWIFCGGPGTRAAHLVRRIISALARRVGFNI